MEEEEVPFGAGEGPLYCHECDNGGWVMIFSHHPPAFEECPKCLNPQELPSP